MAVMKIDEFVSKWFEVMNISKQQKKKRMEIAEELADIVLFFLEEYLYSTAQNIPTTYLLTYLQDEIIKVVDKYSVNDTYTNLYIVKVVQDIYDVTVAHKDEKFFTSQERAFLIAVNEANSIANYTELMDAKQKGYLFKTWCTEQDDRVRPTHVPMEGVTIPIDAYFEFPTCQGLFPRDIINMTAEETCNCRCWLVFEKGKDDDSQTTSGNIENE